MAEKDVDEQFAAIMARWDDVALGLDPSGDPDPDAPDDDDHRPTGDGPTVDDPAGAPEAPVRTDRSDPLGPTFLVDPRSLQRSRRPEDPAEGETSEPPEAGAPLGHRAYEVPDDEEDEHYTPPPPAPLPPSEDKHFWLMMVGLVGGPLLFLYLLLFNRDGNGWWMLLALLVSITGFVLLVLRQPLERDEDDDGIRL